MWGQSPAVRSQVGPLPHTPCVVTLSTPACLSEILCLRLLGEVTGGLRRPTACGALCSLTESRTALASPSEGRGCATYAAGPTVETSTYYVLVQPPTDAGPRGGTSVIRRPRGADTTTPLHARGPGDRMCPLPWSPTTHRPQAPRCPCSPRARSGLQAAAAGSNFT